MDGWYMATHERITFGEMVRGRGVCTGTDYKSAPAGEEEKYYKYFDGLGGGGGMIPGTLYKSAGR